MTKRADKLAKWFKMSDEDKRIYNGFNGFVKNERYSDGNAFSDWIKGKNKRKKRKA